jgi:hypothetical protein
MGFLDFVYPKFESMAFDPWLNSRLDKTWEEGVKHLTNINQKETPGRLVHRSSGWIEIMDEGDLYVSGMITFINPGATRREPFVWLRKEDIFVTQEELVNTLADIELASTMSLQSGPGIQDEEYREWLKKTGYDYILPTSDGLLVMTEFNMVYGDDLMLLPVADGKSLIRRKYWKYFGW